MPSFGSKIRPWHITLVCLLALATEAHANPIALRAGPTWPVMAGVFLAISAVEGIVFLAVMRKRLVWCLTAGVLCNAVSTVPGVLLLSSSSHVFDASDLLVIPASFIVSILIEWPMLRMMWRKVPGRRVRNAVLLANVVTYSILIPLTWALPGIFAYHVL